MELADAGEILTHQLGTDHRVSCRRVVFRGNDGRGQTRLALSHTHLALTP
jgi:hypothetical protein